MATGTLCDISTTAVREQRIFARRHLSSRNHSHFHRVLLASGDITKGRWVCVAYSSYRLLCLLHSPLPRSRLIFRVVCRPRHPLTCRPLTTGPASTSASTAVTAGAVPTGTASAVAPVSPAEWSVEPWATIGKPSVVRGCSVWKATLTGPTS